MSVELLPALDTQEDVKKTGSTSSKGEAKKEGMSLFDSLLKDAKDDTSLSSSDIKKETKTSNKTNHADRKLQTQKTDTKKTIATNEVKDITVDKHEVKQIADELVDIVVEKAKSLKDKKELLKDESKVKEKVVELKENIKNIVKEKTKDIKDSVEDIKKSINELDSSKTKDITGKKDIEKPTETQDESKIITDSLKEKTKGEKTVANELSDNIKITVKEKTKEIKDSVEDIKKSVSKIDSDPKSKIDGKTEQTQKESDKNIEILKSKVEQKTDEIEKAVENIEKDVVKLKSVDKDETSDTVTVNDTKVTKDEKIKTEKTIATSETVNVQEPVHGENELIKISIEKKTETIKKAVDDIEKTVSKVNFVSTDEIVKSIQELKKELQSPKIKVNTPATQVDKNGKNNSSSDKTSLIANGFLQDQKVIKEQTSLQQLSDAKKHIEEKKSVASVKKSAHMLDLDMKDVSVENVGEQGENKAELFAKNNKEFTQNFFNQKALNKMVINSEIDQTKTTHKVNTEVHEQTQKTQTTNNTIATQDSKESSQKKESNVTVNVPQTVVETIQTKIIGAQQKMGSFMSDVARNMYLNYKPPFTAFRMSLNPANLGSISIVMRANKSDNSISVSMNMNNNNTLHAFSENKAALHSALQKELGDGSNVSLDFGMQGDTGSSSFEGSSQNDSSSYSSNSSNRGESSVARQIDEAQEEINETTNYM